MLFQTTRVAALLTVICFTAACSESKQSSIVGIYRFDSERDVNPIIAGIDETEGENPAIVTMLKAMYVGASLTLNEDMSYSLSQDAEFLSATTKNMVTTRGTWSATEGAITFNQTHDAKGAERGRLFWGTRTDGSIALEFTKDPSGQVSTTWFFIKSAQE